MKELICIVCPKGCHLKVDEGNLAVSGNGCERGAEYGKNELTNPTRVVTSTVKITGASINRCPVKTNKPIPKSKMLEAVKALNGVTLASPVAVGDVALKNVCGLSIDFVCTKSM